METTADREWLGQLGGGRGFDGWVSITIRATLKLANSYKSL